MGTDQQQSQTPRIALIGCGAIAELFYLPSLKLHPEIIARLILVDPNESRARKMAEQFGVARTHTDYNDILDEIDGAIIAVPSHLHYRIAMDFLGKGIPILCEKPLAENVTDARAMVEEARQKNVHLMVNNTRRLYGSFQKIKSMIVEKTLGELRSVQYLVGEEFKWPTVSGYYFDTKASLRGVLLDRGAHVLDVMCWWLGAKPSLLSCEIDSFGGRETVTHVQFEHEGCRGEVKMSLLAKFPCRYRLEFTNGTLEGDIYDFQNIEVTQSGRRRVIRAPSDAILYEDIGKTMVRNFVEVLYGKAVPKVTGEDVLASLEFIDECYANAKKFQMDWYENLPELKPVFRGELTETSMKT